jgi:WD40 repeat protein
LTGYDFSGLTIWQTYLQGANLHDCNLAGANNNKSVFSQAITNTLCVEFSPDGKLLATSDANGKVDLWNIENTETQNIEIVFPQGSILNNSSLIKIFRCAQNDKLILQLLTQLGGCNII